MKWLIYVVCILFLFFVEEFCGLFGMGVRGVEDKYMCLYYVVYNIWMLCVLCKYGRVFNCLY